MKPRIHLQNETHIVEWPDTEIGQKKAIEFRKTHKEFKYRRLKRVLQAFPSLIHCGVIYEFDSMFP